MDNRTIATYDQMAAEYDAETTDFWQGFPNSIITTFATSLPPRARVIDVGSGPGRDGLLLKKAGMEVTCLDASEAMIRLSKERGLASVKGDLLNMPFNDGEFDGVWAYTSLLHISKASMPKALQEIRRILKSSGIFGLGLIEGDAEEYRETAGVGQPRLFAFYKQSEVEALLASCGFEVFFFEQFQPRSKRYLNWLAKKV